MMLFYFYFLLHTAFSREGYPEKNIEISYRPGIGAIVKNSACFPVTVSVNLKEIYVPSLAEVKLESQSWGSWKWQPGKAGESSAIKIRSPLMNKDLPDFKEGEGVHQGELINSYDFSIPEGTQVLAMESGIVIRIVQHYHLAHQDLKRVDEVNVIEVLHDDGSLATYAHLKPQSVIPKLCEKIKTGQVLGLTGHNGFSSGPHLHVHLSRPDSSGKFYTIPLKFFSPE
jgi:murein DD-endopeptidase MepM/ murein hydrolase activator NlpD